MSQESRSFDLLHKDIRYWVWQKGWKELRDIQEKAIPVIMEANKDVIISSSTASGKTEAAFLPACSVIAEKRPVGISLLYISPLKALINDQYRRLEELLKKVEIKVTPWHGDVHQKMKRSLLKKPEGIILITPESLESMFINRAAWLKAALDNLQYIIIDEYHSFLDSERGCQLQSLLHRVEFLIQRTIPRIALSATFSEEEMITHFLRPDKSLSCQIIKSSKFKSDLKVQVKGYVDPIDEQEEPAADKIANDLFRLLRGKSHLVFANSRQNTENYAIALSDLSFNSGVPNEFFPHHGNLSKDIRESLEKRLQRKNLPTTAICTSTLELGIDIGDVDSIGQISVPHSVSSLRQRLGRSGRRDNPAILRVFIKEDEVNAQSDIITRLRLQTVQSVAMINLLVQKKYEPYRSDQYNFSTLVQQLLSVIAQYGGVQAKELWFLLCKKGPFSLVDEHLFISLLRALGESDLIHQTSDDEIVLGRRGEKLVNHFSFYSAFLSPEEYRLEASGRIIGSLPILWPLIPGQHMVFAGKRWEILSVDEQKKLVLLRRAKGGRAPKFSGSSLWIETFIRKEMFRLYKSREIPIFLDKTATELYREALDTFNALELDKQCLLSEGSNVHIFPWQSDRLVNTLKLIFYSFGITSFAIGGILTLSDISVHGISKRLLDILKSERIAPLKLTEGIANIAFEKHDRYVPDDLLRIAYAKKFIDIKGAYTFLEALYESIKNRV